MKKISNKQKNIKSLIDKKKCIIAWMMFLSPLFLFMLGYALIGFGYALKIKEVKIIDIKENKIIVEFDKNYGDIETRELKKPFFFKKKIGDWIYVKYNDKNNNIKLSINPDVFEKSGWIIILIGYLSFTYLIIMMVVKLW